MKKNTEKQMKGKWNEVQEIHKLELAEAYLKKIEGKIRNDN